MTPPPPLPDCLRFTFGDTVYHKTEPDRMGIVTAIIFYPGGYFYEVQWGQSQAGKHYECELNAEKGFETSSA